MKMLSVRTCLFFVVVFAAVYATEFEQYKTVETLNGKVRGVRQTTLLKRFAFYSFKGIPYAKPPIGDLRFKPPQPIETWNNVLDAFQHGNNCIQSILFSTEPMSEEQSSISEGQSEDCLTLNVYVPAHIKTGDKLAVLFFIHGGGYAFDSGDDNCYGPDFIIEKEVIVVTINYRLGLFGFLSLNTPEYSGNMGLKDQQLALKWISMNIERFGGDSKRITIFGQSAGGSSIHFHILSAESRKYFRNAIPMSGVTTNYWAMSEHNEHLKFAHKIAADLDEPKETYEELVTFLKSTSVNKLNVYNTWLNSNTLINITFTPVIEKKNTEQPFITDSPQKFYTDNKTEIDFDVLFTTTSAEFMGMIQNTTSLEEELKGDFELPLPFRGLTISKDVERNLTNKIREFYFDGNANTLQQYVNLLSDINFSYEIDKAVKNHASKSNGRTFYTIFSMDSKLNEISESLKAANLSGTSHGDETYYLFRYKSSQSFYDEVINNPEDEGSKVTLEIINNIVNLFTNFAKYGELFDKNHSNIQIQPVQGNNVNYLDLNNDGFIAGLNWKKESFDFLANIEREVRSMNSQKEHKEL